MGEYIVEMLPEVTFIKERLIRCKDCKYMQIEGATRRRCQCMKLNFETNENGYCHIGVKRGE